MEFRDLKTQYQVLKSEIDKAVLNVMTDANFILGSHVRELENQLAQYVGVKHCITCANGTDALTLALKAWNIGPGDAVFVPDFTFFASAEAAAYEGAMPIFVDVEEDTYNMSPASLEQTVKAVLEEGILSPKAVIAVDLFGQPADYLKIREIADKYSMYLLEDGAQGFGGRIGERKACSFGDISTTSFFPAKPLGCYGDGGAVFTDNEAWASLIRSLRVHGKGSDKYDNVRIGINSRLDTIQAAILKVKLNAFQEYELEAVNRAARLYSQELGRWPKLKKQLRIPKVKKGFYSSWAQYSILLNSEEERNGLKAHLKEKHIPSIIYYPKPMSEQTAFLRTDCQRTDLKTTKTLCRKILALPIHPYMQEEDQIRVIREMKAYFLRT